MFIRKIVNNVKDNLKKDQATKKMLNVFQSKDKDEALATIENCLRKGADINAKDKDGYTILIRATQNIKINIVHFLLRKGADVNAKNTIGNTPLHIAGFLGNAEIIQLLLAYGADSNVKNKAGRTAEKVTFSPSTPLL